MNDNYKKTIDSIVSEGPIRFKTLKKYYPFFYMKSITKYRDRVQDDDGNDIEVVYDIDMGEICLSLLSFLFYEGRMKAKTIHYEDIAEFLGMLLEELYDLKFSEESLDKFTSYIIDKMMQENGVGFTFASPKFLPSNADISLRGQAKTEVNRNIKYIEAPPNRKTGQKEYTITADAIEFFLDTKEFGEESKITISLLLLKTMIEHNEYDSALLSLTKVNAEVIQQITKVNEIEMGLMYGGNGGYRAFEEYRALADKRQIEEEELFVATMEQVRTLREDYLDKVKKSELGEKEMNALQCLDKMDKELTKTVELHQQLLGKVVMLTGKSFEILQKKQLNKIKSSFDFENFLDKVEKKGRADIFKETLSPFLPLNIKKQFSLDKINDLFLVVPPKGKEESTTEDDEKDKTFDSDKFNREINERVIYNYKNIYKFLFKSLAENRSTTLEQILENDEVNAKEMFKNPDFVGFILDNIRIKNKDILASDVKGTKSDKESNLLKEVKKELKTEHEWEFDIKVTAITESYIEIEEGFNITNVEFMRK